MSLQEKVRYFQYMRPRYSNPSFASSNVGATLGMPFFPNSNESIKPLPQIKTSNKSQLVQPKQTIVTEQKTPSSPQADNRNHRRTKSHLSNYGTSSLGKLPKFVNERDIYQKQQKKYNIITILPKQYNQTIKKYPIYRLQNIDQNYYRKLKLQEEYAKIPHHNPEIDRNHQVNRQQGQTNMVSGQEINQKNGYQKGLRTKISNNDQL